MLSTAAVNEECTEMQDFRESPQRKIAEERFGKSVVIMGCVAFTAMFNFSWANAYPNTAFESIKSFFNESAIEDGVEDLSDTAFGWYWTLTFNVYFVGAVLACVLTPFSAEGIGRKPSILLGCLLNLVATGTMATAVLLLRPSLFGVGRFILGIGTTLSINCLTLFLQESSPTSIRGLVSSFQEFSVCAATVIGMVAGLRSLLGSDLVLVVMVPAAADLILMLLLFFCPDTPKYLLLNKKDRHRATKAVLFYHGSNANAKQILDETMRESTSANERNSQWANIRLILKERHILKGTLIGGVAGIAQSTTGIFPVTALSTVFFRGAGMSDAWAEAGAIIMVVLNTVTTAVSMNVVDRFGRRPMLIGLGLAATGCLGVFSGMAALQTRLDLKWAGYGSLVAMFAFSICFSLGPGPIPWFVSNELVPQQVRSTVQCVVMGSMMASNLFISTLTLPLYQWMGELAIVILFVLPSLLIHALLFRYLPETKNREIADIVQKLKEGLYLK